MTLKQWEKNGWLKPEPTSRKEISNLQAIVGRDLGDAPATISPDWRFGIAYNAALKAVYDSPSRRGLPTDPWPPTLPDNPGDAVGAWHREEG